jgi:hypothetical protein
VASAPCKLALSSIVLVFILAVGPGCLPAGRPPEPGVTLVPPSSWRPVERTTWMVPGTPLAAWAGPEGSSLVLYRTLPVPGGNAEMLAEATTIAIESLPDARLVVKRTETLAGTAAARVEAVAPGTGDILAPSGLGKPVAPEGKSLIPTRQVTLAFARPNETLYLVAHMPESSHDKIAPEIDAALKTLRLSAAGKTSSQGYEQ